MADEPPAPSGDLLRKKLGPLPTWGWMLVGLALVLVWRFYDARKSKSDGTTDKTTTPTSGYQLPSNIPPQFTQVNEGNYNINSGNTVNNPAAVAAAPVPAPTTPDGKYVTIVKRHGSLANQPFGKPSTIGGVAEAAYGNWTFWSYIWGDPKNAALKASRDNDPLKLQPGDQVWVPAQAPPQSGTDLGGGTPTGPNTGTNDHGGGNRYDHGGSRHNRPGSRDAMRSGH